MNNHCCESSSWLSDEENDSHFDSKSEVSVDSDRVDSDIEIELYSHIQHSFQDESFSINQNQNSFSNSIPNNILIDSISISTETSKGLQNGSVQDECDSVYVSNVINTQVEKFAVQDNSFTKNFDSESYWKISKKKNISKNGKKGKQTRIKEKASIKKETEEFNIDASHASETSSSDSVILLESDSDLCNPGKLLSNLCYGPFIQKKQKHKSFVEDNFVCIDSVSTSSDNSSSEGITLFETPKLFSKVSTLSSSTPVSKIPQNNSNLWHVDHEDLYFCAKGKKNARYHQKQDSMCSKCKKKGHQANSCEEKRQVKCYICGGDHPWLGCSRQVCGRGYDDGHLSKHCQYRAHAIHCFLCKMTGHLVKGCPDLWRRYHLTTSSDTIVKETKVSDRSANYCYNCGHKGHFGHECPKPRMSKDSFPTWPFIVSYNDPKKLLRRHSIGTVRERCRKNKRNSKGQYRNSPHIIPEMIDHKFEKNMKGGAEQKQRLINHLKFRAECRIRIAQHMNGNGNMTYSEPYFPRTPTTGNGSASGSKMKMTGEHWKLKRKQKCKGLM